MIWLRNQRPEKSLTYAYERDKIGKMVKPDNSDLPKEFPLGGFLTKALVESDLTAVQQLFESDSGYFELVQGAPAGGAEAHSFYAQLPPDKTEDDKFVLGLFDETGKLTGVIDLIRDYPEPGHWYFGLLFLDPRYRGQGHGSRIARDLNDILRRAGGRRLRLASVLRNTGAVHFWERLGFTEERRVERSLTPDRSVTLLVLARDL